MLVGGVPNNHLKWAGPRIKEWAAQVGVRTGIPTRDAVQAQMCSSGFPHQTPAPATSLAGLCDLMATPSSAWNPGPGWRLPCCSAPTSFLESAGLCLIVPLGRNVPHRPLGFSLFLSSVAKKGHTQVAPLFPSCEAIPGVPGGGHLEAPGLGVRRQRHLVSQMGLIPSTDSI